MENDYECGEAGSELYQRITKALTVDVPPFHITINGNKVVVHNQKMSYQDVMDFIPPSEKFPGVVFTMTYFRGADNTEGSLYPGSKPATVKNGTSITAVVTNNA